MAMALSDAFSTCDLFSRLLGCDSGDAERLTDVEGVADDEEEVEGEEADEERAAALEAAAARAACVTGMWMPRLGSDKDLRRVL